MCLCYVRSCGGSVDHYLRRRCSACLNCRHSCLAPLLSSLVVNCVLSGAYNLALITDNDITFFNTAGPSYVFFSPCGSVKNASCGGIGNALDVSLCEAYTPLNYTNPSNEYKIAQYDPIRSPVLYTVTSNGLIQYSAAGDYAGNYPRALNTTYICNAAATTPIIVSYSAVQVPHPAGGSQLVYQMIVQTSVVCGAPYQPQQCGYGNINLGGLVGTTVSGKYNGYTYFAAPVSNEPY